MILLIMLHICAMEKVDSSQELIERVLRDETIDVCKPHEDLVHTNHKGITTVLSPYFFCASQGWVRTYYPLLEKHKTFKPKIGDSNGRIALHWAARGDHKDDCEFLINTLHLKATEKDQYGGTPLCHAAVNGCNRTIEFLLASAADSYQPGNNGWTPMHYAAYYDQTSTLQLLLDKGYSLHDKTKKDNTPVDIAKINGKTKAHTFLMEQQKLQVQNLIEPLLTDNKMDITKPHEDLFHINSQGIKTLLSPYFFCAYKGLLCRYYALLVSRKFNSHHKDAEGMTALHWAAAFDHKDDCEFLIETLKLDVLERSKQGFTPLYNAAMNGCSQVLPYILPLIKNCNIKTHNGLTPLHGAAECGRIDAITLLINAGAFVDSQDNTGNTPAHQAAYKKRWRTVQCLISYDTNLCIQNHQGKTPLDYYSSLPEGAFSYFSERPSYLRKGNLTTSSLETKDIMTIAEFFNDTKILALFHGTPVNGSVELPDIPHLEEL